MVGLALEWFHRETLLFVLTFLRRFFVLSPIGGYGEPSVILSCKDINNMNKYMNIYKTQCVCAFMGVYEGNISLKIKNLKTKLCTRDWDLQLKERPNDF